MKGNYLFGTMIALAVGAATAAAQTPAAQAAGTAGKGQGTQTASPAQTTQPITLTGCLTPRPAAANVDSGTVTDGAQAAARSGDYVLQDATEASSNTPKSYVLFGAKDGDLIKLAHSRVEIVGSMDPQPAAMFASGSAIGRSPLGAGNTGGVGTSGSGATAVTGAMRTAGSGTAGTTTQGTVTLDGSGAQPRLKVSSVRQVPGNCGGK
jgi:hypothetical protein